MGFMHQYGFLRRALSFKSKILNYLIIAETITFNQKHRNTCPLAGENFPPVYLSKGIFKYFGADSRVRVCRLLYNKSKDNILSHHKIIL